MLTPRACPPIRKGLDNSEIKKQTQGQGSGGDPGGPGPIQAERGETLDFIRFRGTAGDGFFNLYFPKVSPIPGRLVIDLPPGNGMKGR